MKPHLLVLHVPCLVLLCLAGCTPLYNDDGSADPASPWPWVCEDGGPAPDSGCLPAPTDEAGTDAGSTDGASVDSGGSIDAAPDGGDD
ncbi:MAG: hypothetical protein ACLQVI_14755 [Polyangiaceae bacterium]